MNGNNENELKVQSSGANPLVIKISKLSTYLSQDLFGGPRKIRMSAMVNLHKFLSAFVVAALMICYTNYSIGAWIYLCLHGSYGFIWVMKHFAFRDSRWEVGVTYSGAFVTFLILASYWIAPFLLLSGASGTISPASDIRISSFAILFFVMGLAIMLASDAQKHFSLKAKKELITTGMFKYIRHPNYLGEMMIYASFAIISRHWISWIVLIFWWTSVFLINMKMIESSLSRYKEWKDYKSRTGMLFPRIRKTIPYPPSLSIGKK